MTFSTIVEVTFEYTYAAQVCINRWTYLGQIASEENTREFSGALLAGLGYSGSNAPLAGSMFATILYGLSQGVAGVSLTAFDPWEPTDYVSVPLEEWSGAQITEGLSPVLGFGFKSDRTRRDVRRSTKRFAGLTEGFVGGNGAINAAGMAQASAIGAKMALQIAASRFGTDYTFFPITVSKERYPVPNTMPVRYAYRYYKPRETQLEHYAAIGDWGAYSTSRSQVSRQYGSGR